MSTCSHYYLKKKKVKYFQEKDVSKDFRDTGVGTYNKGKCLTF